MSITFLKSHIVFSKLASTLYSALYLHRQKLGFWERRVVFGLHDLGVITRDTQIGGSSAGSLIAACYHSGLPQDVIIANCAKLAEGEQLRCNVLWKMCIFRYRSVVESKLVRQWVE